MAALNTLGRKIRVLRASMRVAAETNVTQNEAIKQRSGRMLTDLTNENMLNLVTLTAEKADGAVQSDDVTMLCLEYRGNNPI